ncbi:hypothetical protein HYX08_02375 [Candidatus Woesearchaeota archaeon]|nr:hypothetical protein [Candidatus Woesearchaeota archaeon]
MSNTLADKVLNFSKVRVKKISVKVPRLKAGKRPLAKAGSKKTEIPISSIVGILIKNAAEKAKRERKEKIIENGTAYSMLKDGAEFASGGYGSASKGYGASPKASYVDYGKLFSYLGKFRASSSYQNEEEVVAEKNVQLDDSGFFLADKQLMDNGAKYIRYFNSKTPIDKSSLVPMAGMNSAEWEQFKLWMRLDTVMYLLKISTS